MSESSFKLDDRSEIRWMVWLSILMRGNWPSLNHLLRLATDQQLSSRETGKMAVFIKRMWNGLVKRMLSAPIEEKLIELDHALNNFSKDQHDHWASMKAEMDGLQNLFKERFSSAKDDTAQLIGSVGAKNDEVRDHILLLQTELVQLRQKVDELERQQRAASDRAATTVSQLSIFEEDLKNRTEKLKVETKTDLSALRQAQQDHTSTLIRAIGMVKQDIASKSRRALPDVKELRFELQRRATETTADYIEQNMKTVQSVDNNLKVHDVAIEQVTIENGLVLEFGVATGKSVNYIASKKDWKVDGFDSFEGLPEAWRDGYDKGHFEMSELPETAENVALHKGWFHESLPNYLARLDNPDVKIAYLHVDCDLYSSSKVVFDLLAPRIVSGTIIVFDEYFNYDGWLDGEYKAFQEFLEESGLRYEYISYNHKSEQVAVKIL